MAISIQLSMCTIMLQMIYLHVKMFLKKHYQWLYITNLLLYTWAQILPFSFVFMICATVSVFYYGRCFLWCLHPVSWEQLPIFLPLWVSIFISFWRLRWFWKHFGNTVAVTVCFEKVLRLLWLTDGLIESAETMSEIWTVGANFPFASTQRAGCRTQACWATWDSRGKLKFSAGRERGESFKGLVHTFAPSMAYF